MSDTLAPAPEAATPLPDAPAPDAPAEQQPEPAPSQFDPEQLARDMGWSPEDEYRGNKESWIPADEFIKRTAKINKAQREKLERMEQSIEKIAATSERVMKDRLAEQKRELERQFEAAVEVGDVRLAKQTQAQISGLEKQADTGPNHADRFKAENPWFQSNDEATAYAITIAGMEAQKGADPEKQLKAAREAVQKRFPELFPSTSPARTPPVLQGATRAVPTRAKQYPSEVKRAAADMVRRGMVANEAEYYKAYDAENA
jgi:hypothetical protein